MLTLTTQTKYWITRLGWYTPYKVIHILDSVANYLTVGRWFRQHGMKVTVRMRDRYQLFDLVAPHLQDAKVLYLEFGVWEGASMRYWSKCLKNEKSMLHGFDSFEGLPENWDYTTPQGYFSTNGQPPSIQDQRVTFHKGWFENTLPKYNLPEHDYLLLNLDADLYSSTKTVLSHLRKHIVPGTFIYFDEFSDRYHEMKAFDEFLMETGMKFRVIAADLPLSSVMFQRME